MENKPLITIMRFIPGHPLYSDTTVLHDGQVFKAVFGQCLSARGELLTYTMERADTLIAEGLYSFDWYYSPHNKMKVPRLIKDPQGKDIHARELEHHIANYPYELKGCTAHGLTILPKTPMLVSSGRGIKKLFAYLTTEMGANLTAEILYTSQKPNA